MQKLALSAIVDRHRVDRTLTAPPVRSGTEAALAATFSLLFGLTHAEARALVKLAKFDHVTKAELHAAISNDDKPVTGPQIVDVVLCGMRKKLGRYGVEIITVREQGFRLAASARDRLREALGAYGEDIVAAATPPGQPRSKPEAPEPDMNPTTP